MLVFFYAASGTQLETLMLIIFAENDFHKNTPEKKKDVVFGIKKKKRKVYGKKIKIKKTLNKSR